MEPEYSYAGQWFDDMGSLALSFKDSPALGVDIARAHLRRGEANDMALNILRAGISPYAEEPQLGV